MIFTSAEAPFVVALLVVLLIAIAEAASLLFGSTVSGLLDNAAELDADAPDGGDVIGKLFAWLYVGKAPALVVLAAFLASFGLFGLGVSGAARALGAAAPAIASVPIAAALAFPATRFVARGFARLFPREESDAASATSFVGRVAVVIRGEARRGQPAEAKLHDGKGRTHYLLVEPDEAGVVFAQGTEVLLTDRAGARFVGVLNDRPALSPAANGGRNA